MRSFPWILCWILVPLFGLGLGSAWSQGQTRQQFGGKNWESGCSEAQEGVRNCYVVQRIKSRSNDAIKFTTFFTNENGAMDFTVITPSNLYLPGGISIDARGKQLALLQIARCPEGRGGCIATSNSGMDILRGFIFAEKATLEVLTSEHNGI